MLNRKQVKESKAISFIGKLARKGHKISRVKYNGQPSKERYVMVEWTETSGFSLSSIALKKEQSAAVSGTRENEAPWEL